MISQLYRHVLPRQPVRKQSSLPKSIVAGQFPHGLDGAADTSEGVRKATAPIAKITNNDVTKSSFLILRPLVHLLGRGIRKSRGNRNNHNRHQHSPALTRGRSAWLGCALPMTLSGCYSGHDPGINKQDCVGFRRVGRRMANPALGPYPFTFSGCTTATQSRSTRANHTYT